MKNTDKDRTVIWKIITKMLGNPDKSGIYPTSIAYAELEQYIADVRSKAIGNFLSTIDATKWADQWLKTIKVHPEIPEDRDTMIGWFANAIMVGYNAGRNAKEKLK